MIHAGYQELSPVNKGRLNFVRCVSSGLAETSVNLHIDEWSINPEMTDDPCQASTTTSVQTLSDNV